MTDGTAPLGQRLATGVDRFVDRWTPLSRAVGRSVASAHTTAIHRRCRTVVASARFVQWFRREPDATRIVVDLADSRTIGSIVPLAARANSVLPRAVRDAWTVAAGRRSGSWVLSNLVRLVGLLVLTLVGYAIVATGVGASPLGLLALALAIIAGLLGVVVDRSVVALEGSSVVAWIFALLAPPDASDGDAGGS